MTGGILHECIMLLPKPQIIKTPNVKHGIPLYELLVRKASEVSKTIYGIVIALGYL